MLKGRVRNMFPGGNTSKGFFSYYNYIINEEEARRIFILKGGPGVGKSTFMKKISDEMTHRGYDTEHMHCSSDNSSLDGVVIPAAGVALIDGTAPHVVDPKSPGAVDEIINLGDFWDDEAIYKNKSKVITIKKEISTCFARAYRYLKAASNIYEDSAFFYESAINRAPANMAVRELTDVLFGGLAPAAHTGSQRCLFASAITPDGLKNYLDELIATDNVYLLAGFPGAGTEKFLESIKTEAVIRGFNVEAYYCAFYPEKLEHLIIPALNTAFSTVNRHHTTDVCALKTVDFAEFLNNERITARRGEIEYNAQEFDKLLNKAVEVIHSAKALHDELEQCYIPHMDFGAVGKEWEIIMDRILGYAAEAEKSTFSVD